MLLYDLRFCYLCADHVSTSVSFFQIPKCITNFWPSHINDLRHHHSNLEFHNFKTLTAFQLITKLNFDNASKLYLLKNLQQLATWQIIITIIIISKFYFTEKVIGRQFLPYCTLYVTYPFKLTYPVAQPLQQITKDNLWIYAKKLPDYWLVNITPAIR